MTSRMTQIDDDGRMSHGPELSPAQLAPNMTRTTSSQENRVMRLHSKPRWPRIDRRSAPADHREAHGMLTIRMTARALMSSLGRGQTRIINTDLLKQGEPSRLRDNG